MAHSLGGATMAGATTAVLPPPPPCPGSAIAAVGCSGAIVPGSGTTADPAQATPAHATPAHTAPPSQTRRPIHQNNKDGWATH
jgi:hypothetical protein